jgi:lipopolysaccharide/colanic/teichoic acid biosynthesis glycosyltransferase
MKRLLDLLAAGFALLLLAPLILALMLWIRVDSQGPALFRQQRVGRGGVSFRILKLRTMRPDAERVGPRVTGGNDDRITRAGRWLRRYKLDELPQLWNVLVGEMSFVGPRPEVPEYVRLYPVEVRDKVLSVRPGITDPASLLYFDEAAILAQHPDADQAYRELVLPRKLALYCDYVDAHSLAGDLHLIWSTMLAVLGLRRPRGGAG